MEIQIQENPRIKKKSRIFSKYSFDDINDSNRFSK